eukprot:scaffold22166_cov58-Phaeocystis_antarctica.AAC.1
MWSGVRACACACLEGWVCALCIHTHTYTHLKGYVGHCLAHLDEALPRAFAQEAQRHVEGRAAPVLEGVAAVQRVRAVYGAVASRSVCIPVRRDGEQVARAHARGEQRLVRVAPGGVGEQEPLVLADRLGEGCGPTCLEHLLEPRGRRALRHLGQHDRHTRRDGAGGALHGAAVDDQLTQVVEELLAAVLDDGKVEELGRVADEGGGRLA